MFDLGHVALLILAVAAGFWWWRTLGLRDRALAQVRQHCRQADVQLLDESIYLNKIRLGRSKGLRLALVRRYGFEFTVTGERRYDGYIEFHGFRPRHVELAPHPFPGGGPDAADGSFGQRLH
ncbi:DUF3301 domain-containing protein [Halopseudomonas sp.]|uniref:DUF3301 domain-containing protein n=1 Tax=Halopseudomonas sp. TaxID=2901191 RepID=UPI003567099C